MMSHFLFPLFVDNICDSIYVDIIDRGNFGKSLPDNNNPNDGYASRNRSRHKKKEHFNFFYMYISLI